MKDDRELAGTDDCDEPALGLQFPVQQLNGSGSGLVVMTHQELPYYLLCQLTQEPAASQRNLAERFGVSLGKVNYCLRALADKGLVKASNFKRSDNKLAYAYVLTPAGLEEKSRLAKAFLQRKLFEFELLQQEIAALRQEAEKA